MTEQPPSDRLNRASNEIFEATSFLNGTNAAYVEQMYAAWLANPASVDAGWQSYFEQAGEQNLSPTQLGRGPAWKRDSKVAHASGDLIAALTGQDPPAAPGKPGAKGKPAAAMESILKGKLNKYFETNCLLEQGFVKNPELKMEAHLGAVSKQLGDTLSIRRFLRFQIGE